jgi:hypothetical protein
VRIAGDVAERLRNRGRKSLLAKTGPFNGVQTAVYTKASIFTEQSKAKNFALLWTFSRLLKNQASAEKWAARLVITAMGECCPRIHAKDE